MKSHPMVSRHGFQTANNQVPYVVTMLNTTDGPVVLEIPPTSRKTAASTSWHGCAALRRIHRAEE
jgi:hypothetical protein